MNTQKLSKSQIEAKEYVDKHQLDLILNEMLNSLIYNKCDHPTVFMIKFLAAKVPETELKKSGIFIKSQTSSEKSSESFSNHIQSEPETISHLSEETKEPIDSFMKPTEELDDQMSEASETKQKELRKDSSASSRSSSDE